MILYFYTILISCLTLAFIQTTGKTVNNDSLTTIRYIQQKWHALMLFENNGTLLKRQMKNTLSEIDKYDTHTHTHTNTHAHTHTHTHTMIPYNKGTRLAIKVPNVICQGLSWVHFKRKFLNLLYDSDSFQRQVFFSPESCHDRSHVSNCRRRFY